MDASNEQILESYGDNQKYVHLPVNSANGILVARLVLETFYGPFDAQPGYRDHNERNCDFRNLYYKIDSFVQIDDNVWLINDTVFKRIPNYSKYLISLTGVVFGLVRSNFIAYSFNHNHYTTATITDDAGYRAPVKVHRMVYRTYVGEIPQMFTIDHKDERKYHNECQNLIPMGAGDNARKSAKHYVGLKRTYTDNDIREICIMLERGNSFDEIAERFGMADPLEIQSLRRMIFKMIRGSVDGKRTAIINQYDLSKYKSSMLSSSKTSAILTADDVRYIRKNADRFTRIELAEKFHCASSLITLILQRKVWKDID